jgi:CDP-diacylglycerol--glycerol-3-phosphate 3-phosphatidyltransferase
MLDGRWRAKVDKRTTPLGAALAKLGLSPDLLTLAGMIFAAGGAVLIGLGYLQEAVILLVASGLPDLFDGALARSSGKASQRGAFFDSVADRVSDALFIGGIGWYLANGKDPRLAVLALALMAVTFLVSYQRSKAESLGLQARGGLVERAERYVLFGIALIGGNVTLVPMLIVLLVLTSFTAIQRFIRVWRQASAPEKPARQARLLRASSSGRSAWRVSRVAQGAFMPSMRPQSTYGANGMGERWRAWREQRVAQRGRLLGRERERPGRGRQRPTN